jgi:hypothetical protein
VQLTEFVPSTRVAVCEKEVSAQAEDTTAAARRRNLKLFINFSL